MNKNRSSLTTEPDLAIWGRVPPPLGGMATHISRLIPYLEQAGITFRMYSILTPTPYHPQVEQVAHRRLGWYSKILLGKSERVHYVLGARNITRFGGALLSLLRNKKVIIRVGGILSLKDLISRSTNRFAFRHASCVIGVNWEICDRVIECGAKNKNVHHIPGFIPPLDDGRLPNESVIKFIVNHSPILVAAGQILDPNTKDIWGLRSLPRLIQGLVRDYPNLGLIICHYCPDVFTGDKYVYELHHELTKMEIEKNVLLYQSQEDLWPILKMADLYVRPSLSDGDSTTVRESIYFGVPVAASDCVARPEPTIVFQTGNHNGFYQTVLSVLGNLPHYKEITRATKIDGNAEKVVEIINFLLTR